MKYSVRSSSCRKLGKCRMEIAEGRGRGCCQSVVNTLLIFGRALYLQEAWGSVGWKKLSLKAKVACRVWMKWTFVMRTTMLLGMLQCVLTPSNEINMEVKTFSKLHDQEIFPALLKTEKKVVFNASKLHSYFAITKHNLSLPK